MKRLMLLALGLAVLSGGCAHALGYAGQNPGRITCKGKGAITGTGSGSIGAGIGGAGMNAFSLTADCGEGFVFEQGLPTDATPKQP